MNTKPSTTFVGEQKWLIGRPRIMVVACSDGRYQESLDEFLHEHLDIEQYDRLYAPGGPGALAARIHSDSRGEQFRQEAVFLIDAHELDEIILIFHGPDPKTGPPDATCADYRRKLPFASCAEIYQQQALDLAEVKAAILECNNSLRILAFRAEVRDDTHVQFVALDAPETEGTR